MLYPLRVVGFNCASARATLNQTANHIVLYTTKRSRCDMAACFMLCYMPSYESCRKSCANQAVFLGPLEGGGRVAGSTMHLQLIRCCGASRSISLNRQLLVACSCPVRCRTRSGHSRVASRLSAASIRLWLDGDSHCNGFEVAP